MGLAKLAIALLVFGAVCGSNGIKISETESIIGIAILLGGFIAHKES